MESKDIFEDDDLTERYLEAYRSHPEFNTSLFGPIVKYLQCKEGKEDYLFDECIANIPR